MVVKVAICEEELGLFVLLVVEGATATAKPADGRLSRCQVSSPSGLARLALAVCACCQSSVWKSTLNEQYRVL